MPTVLVQSPFYIVLEASSSDPQSNAARLEAFLAAARSSGSGGVLGGSGSNAQREAAAAHIWSVRKNLSEGLRLTGGEVLHLVRAATNTECRWRCKHMHCIIAKLLRMAQESLCRYMQRRSAVLVTAAGP